MNYQIVSCLIFFWGSVVGTDNVAYTQEKADWRNICNGDVIYQHGYCDQPYVVITKDGNWLCTFTTGAGHEGNQGQYIVAAISKDQGRTWSDPIAIESPTGPEASWAMPLITPSGRVYVFYDYNGDNIRTLKGRKIRADMLGWYCYKYSDDHGRTWSKRYRLPVRLTACDQNNDWQGKVQIMWGIGKPITFKNKMYFGFTKLGKYMLSNGEGWFFHSDNILIEPEASKIKWQMLPDGDCGLRAPAFGSVQEEHNLVPLSTGDLYCMYRTTIGHPCHSYSRDGGHTWTQPVYATYTPEGRKFKHPRACPRLWKAKNGKYLFWFHNHGGKSFSDRNPAWLCGGIEIDGEIHWSQPEILLYDPNPKIRMSYPDLIEQDGRYWVTETQKTVARVHEIDPTLLEGLWIQGQTKEVTRSGLVLALNEKELQTEKAKMPRLANLQNGGGFTIDLLLEFFAWEPNQVLLDSRDNQGKGIWLRTTETRSIQCGFSDGKNIARWDCDPGLLHDNTQHHIVVIVDGNSKIISYVVDGLLCDGGTSRQYGWGRFSDILGDINGSKVLFINSDFHGKWKQLKIYNRYLRTSEAVTNWRAVESHVKIPALSP